MNVVPSGSVTFCKGVKLSKNNQRDFKSKLEQQQYFAEREWYKADKVLFIRALGGLWLGSIKVPVLYYRLYTCDYLFYNNAGFNNKIFYCYITGVDYIDTATTRVLFVVDLYQLFLFEYEIDRNTILRKHFSTADTLNMVDNYIDDVMISSEYRLRTTSKINWTLYDANDPGEIEELFVLVVGFVPTLLGEATKWENYFTIFNNDYFPGPVLIWDIKNATDQKWLDIQKLIKNLAAEWLIQFCYIYPNVGGVFTSDLYLTAILEFQLTEVLGGCRQLNHVSDFAYSNALFKTYYDNNKARKIQQLPYVKYLLKFNNGDGIDNINIALSQNKEQLECVIVPRIMYSPLLLVYIKNYQGRNSVYIGNYSVNYDYCLYTSDFPAVRFDTTSLLDILNALYKIGTSIINPVTSFYLSKGQISKQLRDENREAAEYNADAEIYNKTDLISKNDAAREAALDREIETGTPQYIPLYRERAYKSIRLDADIKAELTIMAGKALGNYGGQLLGLVTLMRQPASILSGTVGGRWVSGYVLLLGLYRYEVTLLDTIDKYCERYGFSCYIIDKIYSNSRLRYDYVKCLDIVINGDIPQEAKAYIGLMFTEGVMFWHDNNLFDYSNNGDA